MENLGRCRLLFENVRPSDRAARCRVVGVAGKDMCVEVGNPVPEGEQVHLHRMKLRFDGACYSENVRPVFARRFRVEFSRLRDVPIPPDNDAVARKPAPSVQANLARRESGNEHRVVTLCVATEPGTERTIDPSLALVPVIGPSGGNHRDTLAYPLAPSVWSIARCSRREASPPTVTVFVPASEPSR